MMYMYREREKKEREKDRREKTRKKEKREWKVIQGREKERR